MYDNWEESFAMQLKARFGEKLTGEASTAALQSALTLHKLWGGLDGTALSNGEMPFSSLLPEIDPGVTVQGDRAEETGRAGQPPTGKVGQ